LFNKFDKIVVKVEYDNYEIIKNYFSTTLGSGNNSLCYHSHEDKARGLKITVNHITNLIEFKFSSKILGSRCIELINVFNIRYLWRILYQYVEIPFDKFLFGNVQYCEVVSEVKQDNYWKYIEALHECSRLQNRYKYQKRPNKRNRKSSSFWLKKDQLTKTNPSYISIYNKYNELTDTRKTENVEFLASLEEVDRSRVLEYYRDRIRVENKCEKPRSIKDQFETDDCSLFNILTSNINIVLRKMEEIYKEVIDDRNDVEDLTYREYLKLSAFEQHNFDFEKLYQELRLRGYNREKCKFDKEYRDLWVKSFKRKKSDTIELITELIKKIKWSIKNS
jgi:hypothetical protein